jgi:CRP/FNR family cyclic AMP-dependent transcriptional regulator
MADIASKPLNQQLFPTGAVLIAEGGKLNTMFVLRSGELEVSREGVVVTTIRQPGTIFGEMSVLLDAPHSATVRAITPVEVFVIADALSVLQQRPHLLLQIARLLAKRVANTTATLVAVERDAASHGTLVLPHDTVAGLGGPAV